MPTSESFDAAAFEAALTTRALGRRLLHFETVETTMTIARDEAEQGAPHGTLILAEEQTAGRGRRGRSFFSPPGGSLYFTLVLRLDSDRHNRLPVAVPLAVCLACRAEGVEAGIKWPNDIWAGGRKLAGMLIDAASGTGALTAFPGIGINVNGDPGAVAELRDVATSLQGELGRRVVREPLLARICNTLEASLDLDPGDLLARYRAVSVVLGRRVVISPPAGMPYEATAEAIAPGGVLAVRRDDGSIEEVTSADVSLRPAE